MMDISLMTVPILWWRADLELFKDAGAFFRDLLTTCPSEGVVLGLLGENVVGFRDGESELLNLKADPR